MHDINLGATIARERRAAGITQGELAAHLGVTKAAVSKWELGQSMPDVALLPRIATFFALTLDELFDYRPQLSNEDIRAAYLQLFARFADEPDAVCEQAERLVADHYSCWPLLQQMGLLYLQCAGLAPERMPELARRATALFERVETNADDVELVRGARMMRAVMLSMQDGVDEAIELMESLKSDKPLGIEMLLASMHYQKGDIEASKKLYQASMAASAMNLIACISSQLMLYAEDAAHLEALLRAGEGVLRGFGLEETNPTTALTLLARASTACLMAHDEDGAEGYLARFVALLERHDVEELLFGTRESVLYDLVPELTGIDPDQQEAARTQFQTFAFKEQCKQAVLLQPAWAERADDARFRPLLDRLEAIR